MSNTITTTTTTRSAGGRRPRRLARATLAVGLSVLGVAVASQTTTAATGQTGAHRPSRAICKEVSGPVTDAESQIRAQTPAIFAVNKTRGVDTQFVSFRHRLLKWRGGRWVNVSQTAIWRGLATDATPATDFKSGGKTLRRPVFDFPTGPGYYAIMTDYWWPNGDDSLVANHTPSRDAGYCTFRN
jgi:hypothetical protein